MQVTQYNPYRLQNRRGNNSANFFDGLFDDFLGPTFHLGAQGNKPARNGLQVDIYEKENVIVIEADMPGVIKEDIKLDVKGRLVTLRGERKRNEEIKDEHSYRRERSFGAFERTFSLPFEIDADAVTAKYENGTLRLEISKPENKQSKQIEIN